MQREPTMTRTVEERQISPHEVWTKSGPVLTELPDEELQTVEETTSITLGEPAAMALFGFATGTWIIGVVLGGVLHPETAAVALVAPILIVFAGIAQFIGGLVAYTRSNTFAGTAFTIYGANNVLVGFFVLLQAIHLLPSTGPTMNLLGFDLISFGFMSLVLLVASWNMAHIFKLILAPLVGGFVLAALPDITGQTAGAFQQLGFIGGWLLIASAGFAYYCGAALAINSGWKRLILPVFGKI